MSTLLNVSSTLLPHGQCLLWDSVLLWVHVVADALIATAYYSIPASLLYFVMKRKDVPFSWMFLLFGAFILACGTTHVLGIWTIWHPTYWLDGAIKMMTAAVSVASAIALWPLIPKALALPSPSQLAAVNHQLTTVNERLQAEVTDRMTVQQELETARLNLEVRIQERTDELMKRNEQLKQSEHQLQAANTHLQEKVAELEHFYDIVVGRELKMIELEKEIARLTAAQKAR